MGIARRHGSADDVVYKGRQEMPGFKAVVSFVVASYAGAALAQPADAGLFLSVADNIGTEINGFGPFTDEDLIRTNPAGAFAEAFFAIDAGDLDAFDILPNGNYIVSSLFNGNIGGTVFDDADLVEYNPNTGTIVGNYLGIGLSTFTSSAPDISAATTDDDGNLYFSMLGVTNTMNHSAARSPLPTATSSALTRTPASRASSSTRPTSSTTATATSTASTGTATARSSSAPTRMRSSRVTASLTATSSPTSTARTSPASSSAKPISVTPPTATTSTRYSSTYQHPPAPRCSRSAHLRQHAEEETDR